MPGSPPSRPPRVSVAMASYNHGRFLRENLDSLLGQTFRDFEIVVVDDGSSDDSLDILARVPAPPSSSIRVLTHEGRRNLGMYATLNRAAQRRDGRLRRHPGLGRHLASGKAGAAGIASRRRPERRGRLFPGLRRRRGRALHRAGRKSQLFGNGSEDLLRGLLAHNFVPAMTLVYRRSILRPRRPSGKTCSSRTGTSTSGSRCAPVSSTCLCPWRNIAGIPRRPPAPRRSSGDGMSSGSR